MKSILLNLIFLGILISCNSKKSDNYIDQLNSKESQAHNGSDTLGELISTIEFGVKAEKEELKDFEDGVIPWISIKNSENEIEKLIDADKVVLESSEIIMIIDYPLNKPAKFILKSSTGGFSKKQLISEISKKYKEIYLEEENTAKIKTVPINERKGLINRNETDGKYGIWGHDIGDLDLSSIEVYKSVKGKIEILLLIES